VLEENTVRGAHEYIQTRDIYLRAVLYVLLFLLFFFFLSKRKCTACDVP